MSFDEAKVSSVKILKHEYHFLNQGLEEAIRAVKAGRNKKAKKLVVAARETKFNKGFLKKNYRNG